MAQINISESVGRALYYNYFAISTDYLVVDLSRQTATEGVVSLSEDLKYVVKPDYTISKRGKNKLLGIGLNKSEVEAFLQEMQGKVFNGQALNRFIIVPFVPHAEEYYISFTTEPDNDVLTFSLTGGVDIEENWQSTQKVLLPIEANGEESALLTQALPNHPDLVSYLEKLLKYFRTFGLAFLEINPLVKVESDFVPLDFKGRLDSTAFFHLQKYLDIYALLEQEKSSSPEEALIKQLDDSTGSSLKLKLLNRDARIWPMIAGGGASIIYFDGLVSMGLGKEIGFYGEYSGNPPFELTYTYAKTVLRLLLASKANNKVLIIGGANANFTDIAATFKGIIKAIEEQVSGLQEQKILILVRRGGPNVKEAFKMLAEVGKKYSLDIHLEGVEYDLTHILQHISL